MGQRPTDRGGSKGGVEVATLSSKQKITKFRLNMLQIQNRYLVHNTIEINLVHKHTLFRY